MKDETTPEQTPSLDLPPVQPSPDISTSEVSDNSETNQIERVQGTGKSELLTSDSNQKSSGQPPVLQQASQPISDNQTPQPQSVNTQDDSANPMIADDVDLIEKEWVEKAKSIVNKTKDDPYNQNIEINKIKADYMKKRYNHDLRTSSD